MIVGHQKQWEFLKSMIEVGRVPHALLFSGQDGLGKKKLAIEFAKLLIGEEKLENHPDFILIGSDSNREIQISEIRNLIWKLSLYPYSALYKIAIIDNAHKMNREAQNCFLKTLEEPKGKSILVLITPYPEMLVSTILSRTQKIRFFPIKKSEIENYFINNKVSKEKAEYLSNLCLGRPGLAINFLENKNKINNLEKFVSDVKKLSASDFNFRFQYAKNLSENKLEIKEILDIWLNHFRNLLHLGLEKGLGEDGPPPVESKYSLNKLKKIINSIQSTDYLISTTNINPKLALELLLMEL